MCLCFVFGISLESWLLLKWPLWLWLWLRWQPTTCDEDDDDYNDDIFVVVFCFFFVLLEKLSRSSSAMHSSNTMFWARIQENDSLILSSKRCCWWWRRRNGNGGDTHATKWPGNPKINFHVIIHGINFCFIFFFSVGRRATLFDHAYCIDIDHELWCLWHWPFFGCSISFGSFDVSGKHTRTRARSRSQLDTIHYVLLW